MNYAQKKAGGFGCLIAGLVMMSFSLSAAASEPLPAPLQAKVDTYKKKLVEWAANPAIISAVKESNTGGGVPGMTNGKWDELEAKSPAVVVFETNKAGLLLNKWEEDKGINKLVLRDEKGNLVAASIKPLLYNNATRPVHINGMKGQAWAAAEVKPDPTTQIKSVQASAPVMDGGKVIGVIHTGITVE